MKLENLNKIKSLRFKTVTTFEDQYGDDIVRMFELRCEEGCDEQFSHEGSDFRFFALGQEIDKFYGIANISKEQTEGFKAIVLKVVSAFSALKALNQGNSNVNGIHKGKENGADEDEEASEEQQQQAAAQAVATIADLEAKVATAAAAESRASAAELRAAALKLQLAEKDHQLAEKDDQLALKSVELAGVRAEREAHEVVIKIREGLFFQVEVLKQVVWDKQKTANDLMQQLESKGQDVSTAKQRALKAETKITELKVTTRSHETAKENAKHEANAATNSAKRLDSVVAELKNKNDQLRVANETLKHQASKESEQLSQILANHGFLVMQLKNALKAAKDDAGAALAGKNKEIAELRVAAVASQWQGLAERLPVAAEVEQLQKQLSEATAAKDAAEAATAAAEAATAKAEEKAEEATAADDNADGSCSKVESDGSYSEASDSEDESEEGSYSENSGSGSDSDGSYSASESDEEDESDPGLLGNKNNSKLVGTRATTFQQREEVAPVKQEKKNTIASNGSAANVVKLPLM